MSAAPKPVDAYRHVPYDIEVEQALIGAVIIDNGALARASETGLKDKHFYDPLHQRLWAFMTDALAAAPGKLTPLTIHAALKADGGLMEVGGHRYLAGLAEAAPAMPNVGDYAAILLDLAMRRGLITLGEDIVNTAYEGPAERPARAQIEYAERELDTIAAAWRAFGGATSAPVPVDLVVEDAMAQAERHLAEGTKPGIPTGWTPLDVILGGLHPGNFVLIPARPGMGKSAVLSNLFRALLLSDVPAQFYSLEMVRKELGERMACDADIETRDRNAVPMSYSRFRNGTMSSVDIQRAAVAMQVYRDRPGSIIDADDLTMAEIASRARGFASRFPGRQGVILIDYAQIIRADLRGDRNREQEVSSIARGCKALAKRLGWTVVAAAQINREADKRSEGERRPQLTDLRESGQLEQEADVVIFPYRSAYYVEARRPASRYDGGWQSWYVEWMAVRDKMEMIVRKNRHGPKSTVELWCDMRSGSIRSECPADLLGEDREAQAAQELLI